MQSSNLQAKLITRNSQWSGVLFTNVRTPVSVRKF